MNIYVVILKTDIKYQILRRLFSDHPQLKKGFKLKEILKISPLPFKDRRILREMFGGSYSQVLTPGLNFEYRDGKWEVEEVDIQRRFHQHITKVLNHALKEGKYTIGSLVSTKDTELAQFLMKKEHDIFQEDFSEVEVEGIPINQESSEFISAGLRERLGKESYFNYGFIKAFLDELHDYEGILIRREFG